MNDKLSAKHISFVAQELLGISEAFDDEIGRSPFSLELFDIFISKLALHRRTYQLISTYVYG